MINIFDLPPPTHPTHKKSYNLKYLTDTFVFFKFQCATFIQKKLNLYSLQAIINIFDLPPPTNPTSKKIYNPKYAMDTSIFKKNKNLFSFFIFYDIIHHIIVSLVISFFQMILVISYDLSLNRLYT